MITLFQNKLKEDKETLWKIVNIFHPNLPKTVTTTTRKQGVIIKDSIDLINCYLKYDWVCIDLNIKDYGSVSIGISNCEQSKLFGAKISKQQMAKALKDGTVKFNVWRFYNDKLNVRDSDPIVEYSLKEDAIKILKTSGYQLQSVNEMYQIYYED